MPIRENITLFFPHREHTAITAEQKSAGFQRRQGTLGAIRLNWVTAGTTGGEPDILGQRHRHLHAMQRRVRPGEQGRPGGIRVRPGEQGRPGGIVSNRVREVSPAPSLQKRTYWACLESWVRTRSFLSLHMGLPARLRGTWGTQGSAAAIRRDGKPSSITREALLWGH